MSQARHILYNINRVSAYGPIKWELNSLMDLNKIGLKLFQDLDRTADTEQLYCFYHSLRAKKVRTLILWDCKITYNESRLLQIPKLFWLNIFELKISETAVIPILFKLVNLFIALYESVLLSCFHTTQEVSSWSTIVCIPVSPVAIYPVFEDFKDLKDWEKPCYTPKRHYPETHLKI